MNPQPMVEEKREFDAIMSLFESKLDSSKEISDGLYSKVRSLYEFQLAIDMKDPEVATKRPSGLVSSLNEVLDRIDYLNQRNTEILKHLNTLI